MLPAAPRQGKSIADGSRATRELGIAYTPIRRALAEMIASLRA
jgi:hypothetical protein